MNINEALYSGKIEGSLIKLDKLQLLIDGDELPLLEDDHMCLNIYNLLEEDFNPFPLTMDKLQYVYSKLIYKATPNYYQGMEHEPFIRRVSVGVYSGMQCIYKAPEPEKLNELLEEFINKVNNIQYKNIAEAYASIHWDFVKIHPMIDCNGRTARYLALKYIEYKYPNKAIQSSISEFIYNNRGEYYNSLRQEFTDHRNFIYKVFSSI